MEDQELPDALIFHVFKLLPLDERVRAESVCKDFARVLRGDARLLETLSFDGCDPVRVRQLSSDTLAALLRRGGAALKRLDLSELPDAASLLSSALAQQHMVSIRLPNLAEVTFGHDELLGLEGEGQAALKAVAPAVSRITALGKGLGIYIQASSWDDAGQQYSAAVRAWGTASSIGINLTFTGTEDEGFSAFCRDTFNTFTMSLQNAEADALVRFELSRVALYASDHVSQVCDALVGCPNLRSVYIAWCGLGDAAFAKAASKLLAPTSPIKELCFEGAMAGTCVAPLAAMLASGSRVKELSLFNTSFEEEGVLALARALAVNTSLERLSLFDSRPAELTQWGMEELLASLSRNTTVTLCVGLRDEMGRAWLRRRLITLPEAARVEMLNAEGDEEEEEDDFSDDDGDGYAEEEGGDDGDDVRFL